MSLAWSSGFFGVEYIALAQPVRSLSAQYKRPKYGPVVRLSELSSHDLVRTQWLHEYAYWDALALDYFVQICFCASFA